MYQLSPPHLLQHHLPDDTKNIILLNDKMDDALREKRKASCIPDPQNVKKVRAGSLEAELAAALAQTTVPITGGVYGGGVLQTAASAVGEKTGKGSTNLGLLGRLESPFDAKIESVAKSLSASKAVGANKSGPVLNSQSHHVGGLQGLGSGGHVESEEKGLEDLLTRKLPQAEECSSVLGEEGRKKEADTAVALRGVMEALQHQGSGEEEEAVLAWGLMAVPLLRHQKRAVAWMQRREAQEGSAGGLLADDQGLGKTVSTLGLIMVSPSPCVEDRLTMAKQARLKHQQHLQQQKASKAAPGKAPPPPRLPGGQLIVCPTSVLRQWAREIRDKVSPSAALSVLIHHGPDRTKNAYELLKYDIVITTYAILTMDFPRPLDEDKANDTLGPASSSTPSSAPPAPAAAAPPPAAVGCPSSAPKQSPAGPLFRVQWFRVVLDEAQMIKNPRTLAARAAWGVRAKRRWCLSGTPMQNSVDDLYSYFKFLRAAPYDDQTSFRTLIREPIVKNPELGFKRLQTILQTCMLRRTKASTIDGKPIVNLPERLVQLHSGEFSRGEREFYSKLEERCRQDLTRMTTGGDGTSISTNYVNILWMLLRLRQACNHPSLVKSPGTSGSASPATAKEIQAAQALAPEVRSRLVEAGRGCECRMCLDVPEDPVVPLCGHALCRQCLLSASPSALPSLPSSSSTTSLSSQGGGPPPPHSHSTPDKSSSASASGSGGAGGSPEKGSSSEPPAPCPECSAPLLPGTCFSLAALQACTSNSSSSNSPPNDSSTDDQNNAEFSTDDLEAAHKAWEGRVSCKIRGVVQYLLKVRGREGEEWDEEPTSAGSGPETTTQTKAGKKPKGVARKRTKEEEEEIRVKKTIDQHRISNSDSALAKALPPLSAVPQRLDTAALAGPQTEDRDKVILFSQWTSMLDLLEDPLRRAGLEFRRLDGTMSVQGRERALLDFEEQPKVAVMLMSLKAASVGLNLTCANHVILLDVWWNPTVEDQAIDRVHRLGQRKTVHVRRFAIQNSVEDRILTLQEKKREMISAAFGEDSNGQVQRTRLSMDDLMYLFRG